MTTQRMEAFSDGVIAIIITIMVLELKVPHGHNLADLRPMLPVFLGYALSFVYVGIYWNNHHHLIHLTPRASGGVLWANLHLLFWMSLIPFVTDWLGQNHLEKIPTAAYGLVLLLTAVAFIILQAAIVHANGGDTPLARALGRDWKGKASIVCYVIGVSLACAVPWAAHAMYAAVAIMWFIPDRRMEKQIEQGDA